VLNPLSFSAGPWISSAPGRGSLSRQLPENQEKASIIEIVDAGLGWTVSRRAVDGKTLSRLAARHLDLLDAFGQGASTGLTAFLHKRRFRLSETFSDNREFKGGVLPTINGSGS
jgi:hypothetical protein